MAQSDHEPPVSDTANIHMQMLGEACRFAVTVPLGPRRPIELLAAAREFTLQATAAAVRKAREQGRAISCKAHCGACCRQLVAISVLEAQALAEVIAALPQDRQRVVRERFASAIIRLERAALLDPRARRGDRALIAAAGRGRSTQIKEVSRRYFELGIPCPLLEEESCSIHPDRPLVCREYHVSSPAESCAELYRAAIEKVEPPLHMSDVLARTAARFAGTRARTLPLILALEWMEHRGGSLDRTHDGLTMFKALLDGIDQENQKPFEQRGGTRAGN